MKEHKILLVDDSHSMQEIVASMIEEAGYQNIRKAESGDEALTLLQLWSPDLVILDIIMEGTNGMDVLTKIGKTTKVVIVSAIGQDPIIAQARSLGAIDYLVKPVTQEDITHMLHKHLA
jgi:two-component system, chemotaxis family, chemotaxis protein CheY